MMSKTFMNRLLALIIAVTTVFVCACSSEKEKQPEQTEVVEEIQEEPKHGEIAILFTGNLFGKAKSEADFKTISERAKELKKENINVDMIDLGNFTDPDATAGIDDAIATLKAMRSVGYTHMVINTNEFLYGIDGIRKMIDTDGPTVMSCNFRYSGFEEDITESILKYDIVELGDVKVGYIAITNPEILDTSEDIFVEDGRVAYSFCGRSDSYLCDRIQECIENCKNDGADYIILLSGINATSSLTVIDIAHMTGNSDAVLCAFDGESKSEEIFAVNTTNKEIPIAMTTNSKGAFGEIRISPKGEISFISE